MESECVCVHVCVCLLGFLFRDICSSSAPLLLRWRDVGVGTGLWRQPWERAGLWRQRWERAGLWRQRKSGLQRQPRHRAGPWRQNGRERDAQEAGAPQGPLGHSNVLLEFHQG